MHRGLPWLRNGCQSTHLRIRHEPAVGEGCRRQHAAYPLDDCSHSRRQESRCHWGLGQDRHRALGRRSPAPAAWASSLSMDGGSDHPPRGVWIDAVALELRWYRWLDSADRQFASPHHPASSNWSSRHTRQETTRSRFRRRAIPPWRHLRRSQFSSRSIDHASHVSAPRTYRS